ncbi:LLM class flavin-dependent oxidoreductase [Kineococcus arenarius]|uniref:LLM class flavin-dependent oxidoreductase n=1 Tax=unclassified Kineococcus TaxID=2621656 RepID=UPI003D7D17A0
MSQDPSRPTTQPMGGPETGPTTRLSVMIPVIPSHPEVAEPFAALVRDGSAARLWQGQGSGSDQSLVFAHLAGRGYQIPVGLSVNLMPYHHPFDAVHRARTLASVTRSPLVAGYGPGSLSIQRAVRGAPYRSQLGAVREYVHVLRALLDDQHVDHEGETLTCRAQVAHLPSPPIEIGLGVLRPKMARLAGEIADVAITWLTPATYVRDVLAPALREGAAAAGRPVPRLVVMAPTVLAGPGRNPVHLALAGNGGHLRLPHYVDMLARAGIHTDPADPVHGAASLVAGSAVLHGNGEDIHKQLREYEDAGVDEVVLNLSGVATTLGPQAALADLRRLLTGADR